MAPTFFAVLTLLLLLHLVAAGPHHGPILQVRQNNNSNNNNSNNNNSNNNNSNNNNNNSNTNICSACRDDQQCWLNNDRISYLCHDVTTTTTIVTATTSRPQTQWITYVPAATTTTEWTTVTATTSSLPEFTTPPPSPTPASMLARRQAQGSTITSTVTSTSWVVIGETLYRITVTRNPNPNSLSTSTVQATSTVWTLAIATTPASKMGAPAGAVVGGIVGGVATLGIIVAAGLWWYRRKRRAAAEEPLEKPVTRSHDDDESERNMRSMSPQQRISTPIPAFPLPPPLQLHAPTPMTPTKMSGILVDEEDETAPSVAVALRLTPVSPRLSLEGSQFANTSDTSPVSPLDEMMPPLPPLSQVHAAVRGEVRRKPVPVRDSGEQQRVYDL